MFIDIRDKSPGLYHKPLNTGFMQLLGNECASLNCSLIGHYHLRNPFRDQVLGRGEDETTDKKNEIGENKIHIITKVCLDNNQ